jgi:hypothetical protein
MDQFDRLVETVRFLMASTKKLSDAFQDSENRVRSSFDNVAKDVEEIERRLECVEEQLVEQRDISLVAHRSSSPELPTAQSSSSRIIPALNISVDVIADIYLSAPALLEPFSRPCSLTARTLNGETDVIELEVASHSMTWVLETAESNWLLIPRPGLLERRHQIQSLERLFDIQGTEHFPATLQLVKPAVLEAVVSGQRWQLVERGVLDQNADPTKVSISERLRLLELRMSLLEKPPET